MRQMPEKPGRKWIPQGLILTLVLVSSIWAVSYFRAEARVRRATVRVVALAEKAGEESPVALGLAANRLGSYMATNAVLELSEYGALATSRSEIVSLFARIRSSLETIAFEDPEILVQTTGDGDVEARVSAQYRLVPVTGEAAEGSGKAELRWVKGKDGWKIARAVLRAAEGGTLPGGWK